MGPGEIQHLYHGTSLSRFRQILARGVIAPRGPGKKGNWPTSPAHSEMVYLTDAYPHHFAVAAATGTHDWPVIIEVDPLLMGTSRFYPDEDYLAQRHCNRVGGNLLKQTRRYRRQLVEHRPVWVDSLRELGTVAFRGRVERRFWTRVLLLRSFAYGAILDPTITMANRKIMGRFHQDGTKWLFGDGPLTHSILGFEFPHPEEVQVVPAEEAERILE